MIRSDESTDVTVGAVVADQRLFVVVALVAGAALLLVPGWGGSTATWSTIAALWGGGALHAAWSSRGTERDWLIARVGVQNVAIQALVAAPGIARGLVRFATESPGEIGSAFVSNALVTLLALPLMSAVVLTCAGLVVAVPAHGVLRRFAVLVMVAGTTLAAGSPALATPGPACTSEARVELDHVPVVVADLEAAAERFGALGFVLKPGRPHPNGLRNVHAKFADGREIELITATRASDELARWYRSLLEAGPGPAFLALHAGSVRDVAEELAGAATAGHLAGSTLSFPPGHIWRDLFFAELNFSPTDEPEHFLHPNTATTLEAVWIAGALDPELDLLARFGAAICPQGVELPGVGEAVELRLRGGVIHGLSADSAIYPGRRLVGLSVKVTALEAVLERAGSAGLLSFAGEVAGRRSLVVDLRASMGMWLEFRQTEGSASDAGVMTALPSSDG